LSFLNLSDFDLLDSFNLLILSDIQLDIYGRKYSVNPESEGGNTVKKIALLMLTALPFLTLAAQMDVKAVKEPEYLGVVFYLDPTGALSPLERQQPNIQSKAIGLGYGGAKTSTIYKGAKSPVRFKAGQDIQFVVRMNAPGIEPDSLVKLDVLKVSKDQREMLLAKAGAMGFGGVKSTNGQTSQTLNFSKYGEQSLKVSPAGPLGPGEYVITAMGGQSRFLFGIDPQ
jgi:hypothetical protein